ncbi:MAG: hypothetical protein MPJ50_07155 [Pirellulales bacterium]|nr:hypothetical protein [Pirellulales bacterium]
MKRTFLIACLMSAMFAAGCGDDPQETTIASNVDVSQYFLAAEPENPINIHDAFKADNDGEEITLVGRIGGSPDPWVEGRASFTLTDMSKLPCADDHNCPTPWDYCCSGDLSEFMASVKISDEGKTVNADARTAFGLKELETVVVEGTVQRDEGGNLRVLANGIYVRKESGGE